jgi:hypothetical protein
MRVHRPGRGWGRERRRGGIELGLGQWRVVGIRYAGPSLFVYDFYRGGLFVWTQPSPQRTGWARLLWFNTVGWAVSCGDSPCR